MVNYAPNLKLLILSGLTNTDIKLPSNRNIQILSKTCFWVKENFSAIIKYYGCKYYSYWNRTINDISMERM